MTDPIYLDYCDDCDKELQPGWNDGVYTRHGTVCYGCLWQRYTDLAAADYKPTVPIYRIGDKVRAFNGQKRIVTKMSWSHSAWRKGNQLVWAWWLETVDPDDPKCIGSGIEWSYTPDHE